jgi:putative endonuclease
MKHGGMVYILSNAHHTVFYTGVTADPSSRIREHWLKVYPKSFTARYNIFKLLYYEVYPRIEGAIDREKQIKKYSRKKKFDLIVKMNPEWRDLFEDIKDW